DRPELLDAQLEGLELLTDVRQPATVTVDPDIWGARQRGEWCLDLHSRVQQRDHLLGTVLVPCLDCSVDGREVRLGHRTEYVAASGSLPDAGRLQALRCLLCGLRLRRCVAVCLD